MFGKDYSQEIKEIREGLMSEVDKKRCSGGVMGLKEAYET